MVKIEEEERRSEPVKLEIKEEEKSEEWGEVEENIKSIFARKPRPIALLSKEQKESPSWQQIKK